MKRLRNIWKNYLIRPILYKCVTKCAIALAGVLLWDRFWNVSGVLSALRDGCFMAALILLCATWFSYLQLDGVKFLPLWAERERQKNRKRWHWTKSIADFTDEHIIIAWDELTEEERQFCGLLSSGISALLYLIPSLIALAL